MVRYLKSSRHFPLAQLVCYTLFPAIYLFPPVDGRPDFRWLPRVTKPPTAIPYKSIFNLDFQSSKSPASSDATALGCATRFNISPVNTPGLMNNRRFQGLSAASSLRHHLSDAHGLWKAE